MKTRKCYFCANHMPEKDTNFISFVEARFGVDTSTVPCCRGCAMTKRYKIVKIEIVS